MKILIGLLGSPISFDFGSRDLFFKNLDHYMYFQWIYNLLPSIQVLLNPNPSLQDDVKIVNGVVFPYDDLGAARPHNFGVLYHVLNNLGVARLGEFLEVLDIQQFFEEEGVLCVAPVLWSFGEDGGNMIHPVGVCSESVFLDEQPRGSSLACGRHIIFIVYIMSSDIIWNLPASVQQHISHLSIGESSAQAQHIFDFLFQDCVIVEFVPPFARLVDPGHVMAAEDTVPEMSDSSDEIVLASRVPCIELSI